MFKFGAYELIRIFAYLAFQKCISVDKRTAQAWGLNIARLRGLEQRNVKCLYAPRGLESVAAVARLHTGAASRNSARAASVLAGPNI